MKNCKHNIINTVLQWNTDNFLLNTFEHVYHQNYRLYFTMNTKRHYYVLVLQEQLNIDDIKIHTMRKLIKLTSYWKLTVQSRLLLCIISFFYNFVLQSLQNIQYLSKNEQNCNKYNQYWKYNLNLREHTILKKTWVGNKVIRM